MKEAGWVSFLAGVMDFQTGRGIPHQSVKPKDNFLFTETLTLSKSSDAESLGINIER